MDIQILAQQFYDYSIYTKGYSKYTVRRYRYVIDLYCQLSHIETIDQVSQENARALLFHGRAVRKWSTNTLMIFHVSLLVFFRWCVANGHLQHNPVIGIEKTKIEQKLPKKFTKQESLRLLDIVYNYPYSQKFLRYRNHAIFAMFIFAGLRKQELLKLKYADIDLDNCTLFVNQGKGGKDRIVPLTNALVLILRKYVEQRKMLNKTCPEFFVSFNRNMGFTDNGLKHLVEDIRKACDIKFSVHKLRHTFATLMLEGGCDIYSLSRMMGHSDIKTTTIYLHATAEHLRAQIEKHPLN